MLIQNPPAEITDRLFMLGTTPYPVFLYRGGEQATLFEGGVGCVGPLVLEQLDALGVDGESVTQVVVTHAHPDHVMAVPLFHETFPNVRVVASDVAAKTMAAEKAISFFAKIDGAFTQSLTAGGFVEERHSPKPLADMQIAVDRVIGPGETVEVGDGVAFNVIATPGHSDCSLCFHEPNEGILVISDVAGYTMPGPDYWWPDYFTDYAAYVRSIETVAALNAEVLCFGHNVVVTGAAEVKACLDAAVRATEDYHQRIVADATAGKSTREIAEQLGAEVYEHCQFLPLDFFQKNCGLMVKLSLKHEGIGGQ